MQMELIGKSNEIREKGKKYGKITGKIIEEDGF